ncbi:MAG: Na+:solute symporter [Deltaproteobacteria bacterium]|nr:Na+:solute symporter [Deltaproteobacteria bacterium]
MQRLTNLDAIVVIVFFALSIGIGLAFTRRAGKSLSEYFVSGRSLPWWLLGTSMVATTFSADTPLVVTEFVRGDGIWGNFYWWSYALAHALAVAVFSRLWRRAGVMTDQELIELRYAGRKAAVLRAFKAFVLAGPYNIIIMAWSLDAMATILRVAIPDLDATLAVVVVSALALVYSASAGLWGVVVTDFFQFIVAIVGAVLLAVYGFESVPGASITDAVAASANVGLADAMALANAAAGGAPGAAGLVGALFTGIPRDAAATLSFTPSLTSPDFPKLAVYVGLLWWSYFGADGGGYIMQRMAAGKDERHARLGTLWFAVAHYALRTWPWIVAALATVALFPNLLANDKFAYPLLMNERLPPGLLGIMLASFLAAFMSTIVTHINWGASYFVNDFYRRFLKPAESDRHYLWASRLASIGVMIVAAIVALTIIGALSAAWQFVWTMGAGLGAALILRWFWWRVNAWSEFTALAVSLILAPILAFVDWPFHVKAVVVVGCALPTWLVVTLATRPEPAPHLDAFYRRVRPPGAWGPVRARCDDVPHALSRWILAEWLGVVALLTGLTFALGSLVLGNPAYSAAWAAVAITGGLVTRLSNHRTADKTD